MSTAVYVGLRSEQQLPWGHGGPTVVGVVDGETRRPLGKADPEWNEARGFEWGYDGAGPQVLAESILLDCIGFDLGGLTVLAFAREVVAKLPPEFELPAQEVVAWIAEKLIQSCHEAIHAEQAS